MREMEAIWSGSCPECGARIEIGSQIAKGEGHARFTCVACSRVKPTRSARVVLARRAEPCRVCATPIAVGDELARGLGGALVCMRCGEEPPVDEHGNPRVVSRRSKECRRCGEPVAKGEWVTVAPTGEHVCTLCSKDPMELLRYFNAKRRRRKGSG